MKDIVFKYGLLIGAIFMMTISFLIIWNINKTRLITERGIEATATIIKSPTDCENMGRRADYATLEFNGKTFVKQAPNGICQLISGKKTIKMFTNKEKDELIFKTEYEEKSYIFGILLIIISGLIGFKGLKQARL